MPGGFFFGKSLVVLMIESQISALTGPLEPHSTFGACHPILTRHPSKINWFGAMIIPLGSEDTTSRSLTLISFRTRPFQGRIPSAKIKRGPCALKTPRTQARALRSFSPKTGAPLHGASASGSGFGIILSNLQLIDDANGHGTGHRVNEQTTSTASGGPGPS